MLACATEESARRVPPSQALDSPEMSLGSDHGCDRCCCHTECEALRGKRWCQRFAQITCETSAPVGAEELIKRFGRFSYPAVKRCMVVQRDTGGLATITTTTHSAVVEWDRDGPSPEPELETRLNERARDELFTAADGCISVQSWMLSCCGYGADSGIGVWSGDMKLGLVAGDRDLLDDLKREFAVVRPVLGQ
ncbi:hypothetical protein VFPFJ_11757 [Purpureocillium lilacinum]|uniref:Uncharacterized protein n=1 Tax=Purpureocillium lilacinum TaxID=33203 RepID=A0A179EVZ8_PURLI|nr:hypothetical protein VFPFJ_11757 [Purpureocillium lilacinum]OAQ57365.1 hypothetical protein VFPFJ_11757 [Purpureocillium lilacinum]